MDRDWKSRVGRVFTFQTPDQSTVVRQGSSTWVGCRQWVPAGAAKPANPAGPATLEETLSASHVCDRALAASFIAFCVAMTVIPTASADDVTVDGASPGPVVQVAPGPTADNADPAALAACALFGQVLDGSSSYYGDFADSLEGSDY